MPEFYTLLSQHYDTLFPAEPEIVGFLETELARGGTVEEGRVIDAACGTGNYTDALSRHGLACHGFDASRDMIEVARKQQKRGTFEVRALEEMGGLTGGEGGAPVDARWCGLFCIGNSLPHLGDRAGVADFFRNAARVLEPAGQLVVQTLNLARFDPAGEAGGEVELPPIERNKITMRRTYRPASEEGQVLFHAELTDSRGRSVKSDTSLPALSVDELTRYARSAGFRDVTTFGSYARGPYDPDSSFVVVLTALRAP